MIPIGQHEPGDVLGGWSDADLPPLVDPAGAGAAVPVLDDGDPLVAVPEGGRISLLNLYRADGWAGTDETVRLRRAVLDRLVAAAAALPDGFGLAVFDGWRSPTTVRALYDHFYGPGSTLEPGFLADPDDPHVVPPHGTGAAVDLTLTWQGRALALGTCFDDFTDRSHLRSLEGATGGADLTARDLRRLLHHRLGQVGFVGLAEEWWHVSYGDQRWAAATGAPAARSGPIEP